MTATGSEKICSCAASSQSSRRDRTERCLSISTIAATRPLYNVGTQIHGMNRPGIAGGSMCGRLSVGEGLTGIIALLVGAAMCPT